MNFEAYLLAVRVDVVESADAVTAVVDEDLVRLVGCRVAVTGPTRFVLRVEAAHRRQRRRGHRNHHLHQPSNPWLMVKKKTKKNEILQTVNPLYYSEPIIGDTSTRVSMFDGNYRGNLDRNESANGSDLHDGRDILLDDRFLVRFPFMEDWSDVVERKNRTVDGRHHHSGVSVVERGLLFIVGVGDLEEDGALLTSAHSVGVSDPVDVERTWTAWPSAALAAAALAAAWAAAWAALAAWTSGVSCGAWGRTLDRTRKPCASAT